MVRFLLQASHALVAANVCTLGACCTCKCLCYLRWVDVAIQWVPQCADKVVGFNKRVDLLQFGGGEYVVLHAIGASHRCDMFEFGHALFGVCEAHGTSDVIVDGEIWIFSELGVQLGRVLLHLHDAPAAGVGGHVARRVPGGAFGQFVALQQEHVGASHFGKVVQGADARNAAADDDNFYALAHWEPLVDNWLDRTWLQTSIYRCDNIGRLIYYRQISRREKTCLICQVMPV